MNRKGFSLVKLLIFLIILGCLIFYLSKKSFDIDDVFKNKENDNVVSTAKLRVFKSNVGFIFSSIESRVILDDDLLNGGNISEIANSSLKGDFKFVNKKLYLCNINDGDYYVVGDSDNCFSRDDYQNDFKLEKVK